MERRDEGRNYTPWPVRRGQGRQFIAGLPLSSTKTKPESNGSDTSQFITFHHSVLPCQQQPRRGVALTSGKIFGGLGESTNKRILTAKSIACRFNAPLARYCRRPEWCPVCPACQVCSPSPASRADAYPRRYSGDPPAPIIQTLNARAKWKTQGKHRVLSAISAGKCTESDPW